jgi:hypothetical protein
MAASVLRWEAGGIRLALRLQQDFPNARLEAVSGARAFVPEDAPERLARLVRELSEEVVNRPPVARGSSQGEGSSGD